MTTVAALFVATGGCYFGLEGVDPWDQKRDARKYTGPHPVVAHPPCARWCRLAGLVEARWGHKRGEDGGMFASALANVRRVGGVLEHPAYSDAWAKFLLPEPPRHGGWVRGLCGGWSAHVEQWHYGHAAKKATWLYAHGINELPALRWGSTPDTELTAYVTNDKGKRETQRRERAWVSWCGYRTKSGGEDRPRLNKRQASATPLPFRDLLLSMARSVRGGQ